MFCRYFYFHNNLFADWNENIIFAQPKYKTTKKNTGRANSIGILINKKSKPRILSFANGGPYKTLVD